MVDLGYGEVGESVRCAYSSLVGFFGVESVFGIEEGRAGKCQSCYRESNALFGISSGALCAG